MPRTRPNRFQNPDHLPDCIHFNLLTAALPSQELLIRFFHTKFADEIATFAPRKFSTFKLI